MEKLRENTNNIAAALENEAAECLRHALQRRHTHVERLAAKICVPGNGAEMFELDGVVVTDNSVAVVEAKTVLNEAAATQLQRNVLIIKCAAQPTAGILLLARMCTVSA